MSVSDYLFDLVTSFRYRGTIGNSYNKTADAGSSKLEYQLPVTHVCDDFVEAETFMFFHYYCSVCGDFQCSTAKW